MPGVPIVIGGSGASFCGGNDGEPL